MSSAEEALHFPEMQNYVVIQTAQNVFTTHTVTAGIEPRHLKHDRYNKCLRPFGHQITQAKVVLGLAAALSVPLFVPDDAVGKI